MTRSTTSGLPALVATFVVMALALGTGCKTIVRENIISSIDTGVGATIAENKQTQSYELKAGYIRSQFYSIPTGKLVENPGAATNTQIVTDNQGKPGSGKFSNAANVTPEMVSGIKSHSGLGDLLLGMDVSENFAVGEVAVNSQAAIAMYIANAANPTNAKAAADATGYSYQNDPNLRHDQETLDTLLKKNLKPGVQMIGKPAGTSYRSDQTRDYARALAEQVGKPLKTIRQAGGKDLEDMIKKLQDNTQ